MIELNNVSYSYKNRVAVKDISLKIEKGESVAVLGANGSGKSTFLKLINGLIFPDKGTYSFEGEEINEKKMRESRFSKLFHKKIGFVFQNSDAQLFCSSVYEEVAFGPRQMGMSEEEIQMRVEDCLNLLHIQEIRDVAPYNLSGGEKKRVAIASVLSLNPDILVLDEPMNNLDPRTKRFLRDILIKINTYGKTIICVTHDFEYLEGVFKKAVVFSKEHLLIRADDYKKIVNDKKFLIQQNVL